ncbi:MAG: hypothetical protein OXC68_04805 [Aestuariivita sp.]|nr:hypothetical protein [Aestuariivita sp.]
MSVMNMTLDTDSASIQPNRLRIIFFERDTIMDLTDAMQALLRETGTVPSSRARSF